MNTHSPTGSPLGHDTAYPNHYDASLLYPIPRVQARSTLGLDESSLPFIGHDRWQVFELSWLDTRGKPHVATATLYVPAAAPCLIESKSLKLYFNSFNASRFESSDAVRSRIMADLSQAAGAPVTLDFGVPATEVSGDAINIDALEIDVEHYGPPDATLLRSDASQIIAETLHSALLKSNCPVTGQPDWANVSITYAGPKIDRESLLRYIISFRDHAEFHEQCVERLFIEISTHCAPQQLSIEARYTRRGGLDINPWRATPGTPAPAASRTLRQ